MRRFVLTLFAVIFLVADAHAAIQLGDSREKIIAQCGIPIGGDANVESAMYRWTGWRLDIGFVQGSAHWLIFTRDGMSISVTEQQQILNDNGGIASWQPVENTAAVSKWRRTKDGAEAFAGGQSMTLFTKNWALAQAANEFQASRQQVAIPEPKPSRIIVTAPAIDPLAAMLSRLTMMAVGAVVLIGIIRLLVKQSSKSAESAGVSLRTPKRLRSACALPPPLPFSAVDRLPPARPFIATAALVAAKPKTIADLPWQEFELMIGELYRRKGYTVEICSGDGADGGVDLTLRKDGTTVLVQCKHWKVYQVGVSTVREMFGILTAEKADRAILVTTGKFTRDAALFAAGKPLDLIDGARLNVLIEQASRNEECGHLLDVASWSGTFARAAVVTAPACPMCRGKMIIRAGRQSGNRFWGCSTYPRCRGKRNVRAELMGA